MNARYERESIFLNNRNNLRNELDQKPSWIVWKLGAKREHFSGKRAFYITERYNSRYNLKGSSFIFKRNFFRLKQIQFREVDEWKKNSQI